MTDPAAALGDLLEAEGVLCPAARLHALWAQANPALTNTAERAAALAAAVRRLAEAGRVELPRGKAGWDTAYRPPLPRFVRVPAARRPPRPRDWVEHPWAPELGWVASLRTLAGDQYADLVIVNAWLRNTRGRTVDSVPQRHRSAELFGNEKRLDALATSVLFRPGRLSWSLLAAEPVPPPLACRHVGSGPGVLIVENSDPFWVTVRLAESGAVPLGWVVWGAGNAVRQSIPVLTHEPGIAGPVWYWGDLDSEGLAIAADAASALADTSLAPLRPAVALYRAMVDAVSVGGPQPARRSWAPTPAAAAWLGAKLCESVIAAVGPVGRYAQEMLTPDQIAEAVRSLTVDP